MKFNDNGLSTLGILTHQTWKSGTAIRPLFAGPGTNTVLYVLKLRYSGVLCHQGYYSCRMFFACISKCMKWPFFVLHYSTITMCHNQINCELHSKFLKHGGQCVLCQTRVRYTRDALFYAYRLLIIEGPSGKRGHEPFEIFILLKTEWLVLAMWIILSLSKQ